MTKPSVPSMRALTDTPASLGAQANPFPGPRPYQRTDADRFFGRGDEINELTSLVLSTSAVLLAAPSGTGKSSLINAGLIPTLDEYEFTVISVRFGEHAATMQHSAHITGANPFSSAVVAAIAESRAVEITDDRLPTAMNCLGSAAPASGGYLLVLDQFEEIFSNYPTHWMERSPFFRELRGGLESNPNLRALLAIRSDYLASLSPYQREIPSQLAVRYNLESLRADAAAEAVRRTFEESGRPLSEVDITALIDGLLTIWVRDKRLDVKGEFVNLIQLQIVCRGHWEKLAAADRNGDQTVGARETSAFIDVDRAMDEFVDASIANTVRTTRCDESMVRHWLEAVLITPNDRRALVLVGDKETDGLDNSVVDKLEDERLVASEHRNLERWVELTHDSMIRAVHRSNDRWHTARSRRRQRWRNWLAGVIVLLVGLFFLLHRESAAARVQGYLSPSGPAPRLTFTAEPDHVMLISASVGFTPRSDQQAANPRLVIHPAGNAQTVVAQAEVRSASVRGDISLATTFRSSDSTEYTAVLDADGFAGANFDIVATSVPIVITAEEVATVHQEMVATDQLGAQFAVALPPNRPISVSVESAQLISVTGGEVLAKGDKSAIVVGRGQHQFAVLELLAYSGTRVPIWTQVLDGDGEPLVVDSQPRITRTNANVAEYTIASQRAEPIVIGAVCRSEVLVALFDDKNQPVAASSTPETEAQARSSYDTNEFLVVNLPVGRYHAVFATDTYDINLPVECSIAAQRLTKHTVTSQTVAELRSVEGRSFVAYLVKTGGEAVIIADTVQSADLTLRCGQTGTTQSSGPDDRLIAIVPDTGDCVIILVPFREASGSARVRLVELETGARG